MRSVLHVHIHQLGRRLHILAQIPSAHDRLVLARRSAEKTLPLELPTPWQAEFDDLEWRDLLHAGRGCPPHGFSALHHGLQAAARTGHGSGSPQR
jgi:hypothetical protein